MPESRFLPLFAVAILLSLFAFKANASSDKSFDCNEYPPHIVSDWSVDGSASIKGLRRFVDAELKGKVQLQAKKYLANNPDANQATVALALIAYNCRAIQAANLSEDKKFEARERVTRIILETITGKSQGRTAPEKESKRENAQSNQKRPSTSAATESADSSPPSLMLVADSLHRAARIFKKALNSTYFSTLGGAYIPVIPYELMLHQMMLDMAAEQNLMRGIPNVKTFPEDAETSLAYGICTNVAEGKKIIETTFTLYNSKIPEYLIHEIHEIQSTTLYRYFLTYLADCSIFQGELRHERAMKTQDTQDQNNYAFYAVPREKPKFTPDQLKEYITRVKKLETDTLAILTPKHK